MYNIHIGHLDQTDSNLATKRICYGLATELSKRAHFGSNSINEVATRCSQVHKVPPAISCGD